VSWLQVTVPLAVVGGLFVLYAGYNLVRLGMGGSSKISGNYGTFDPSSQQPHVRKGLAIVLQRGNRVTMYVARDQARRFADVSPEAVFLQRIDPSGEDRTYIL